MTSAIACSQKGRQDCSAYFRVHRDSTSGGSGRGSRGDSERDGRLWIYRSMSISRILIELRTLDTLQRNKEGGNFPLADCKMLGFWPVLFEIMHCTNFF